MLGNPFQHLNDAWAHDAILRCAVATLLLLLMAYAALSVLDTLSYSGRVKRIIGGAYLTALLLATLSIIAPKLAQALRERKAQRDENERIQGERDEHR